jgi:hypothetical protein
VPKTEINAWPSFNTPAYARFSADLKLFVATVRLSEYMYIHLSQNFDVFPPVNVRAFILLRFHRKVENFVNLFFFVSLCNI